MAKAVTEQNKEVSKEDLLSKLTTLESRVQVLERERNSCLFSKRSELHGLFGGLEEVELRLTAQRKSEKQELKQSIVRIQTNVANFQRMLTDMRPGPTYVEALKKAMEDIESSVSVFKEKQRQTYEQLLHEEKTMSVELEAFGKKLDSWSTSKHPPSTNTVMPAAVDKTRQSSIPTAVLAFERFLGQTGGRTGGWEEFDHQAFVRIRTKFNGHPLYLEAAVSELPTKTMDDIRRHDQWYSEFLALLENKKGAIEEWRRNKQSSKVTPQSDMPVKEKARLREEQLVREREERKQKLAEWKAQQAVKHQQEEVERAQLKAEQHKLVERELKRKAAVKAQVVEYVHEKELAKLADRLRMEEKRQEEFERRRIANKEVEHFRERDARLIETRKEKVKKREEESQLRVEALEKTKEVVQATRDPKRLFKLTAGWEARRKAEVKEGNGVPIILPRRAVPTWRQGL